MNNFIKVLAEEVLKEDFDIKTLALKFFNKHPTLLKQIQKLACKQSIPQIKLSNYDHSIIKEIYINKNTEKAKQLINSRYKPGDKKFGELMDLINVNEAKNNALLAIGFALALGAGLLSGCANPLAGGEEIYNHVTNTIEDEYIEEFQNNFGKVYKEENKVFFYNSSKSWEIIGIKGIYVKTIVRNPNYALQPGESKYWRKAMFYAQYLNFYDYKAEKDLFSIEPGEEKNILLNKNENMVGVIFNFLNPKSGEKKQVIVYNNGIRWPWGSSIIQNIENEYDKFIKLQETVYCGEKYNNYQIDNLNELKLNKFISINDIISKSYTSSNYIDIPWDGLEIKLDL